MVFGGLNQKRQISLIDQCSLNRVGTLEFNFNNGACTTAYDQVYLCFDERNTKQCYTASGRDSQKSLLDKNCSISNPVSDPLETFTTLRKSSYSHKTIRIASSDTELAAIGSGEGHSKSEIFSFESKRWSTKATYPFHSTIDSAAVVYHSGFVIFGGWNGPNVVKKWCTIILIYSERSN